MNKNVFKAAPAVFAVGNAYQIMVSVKCETLMWVRIGDRCFYDHANGTLKSAVDIHRMTVPQKLLDEAREYSICYRIVKERKPYFTETEEVVSEVFAFNPVGESGAKAYLIADAHNEVTATVNAVKQFERRNGEIDFLILAGDIPDHSGCVENFDTIYEIIGQVTNGTKPVVYAKGNHDLRGICAEKMEEYAPNLNGRSYFSFRIGNIWGVSLDCGEDKDDSHAEYGHTVCCHEFRLEETEYIKEVIKNADREYLADGVKHRIVVCHNPFSCRYEPPFDIEEEIFAEWCSLLREHIKPEIMISGHRHCLSVSDPGDEGDYRGQPCRVVVGTKPFRDEDGSRHFIGTGFFISDTGITFEFNDDMGNLYQA